MDKKITNDQNYDRTEGLDEAWVEEMAKWGLCPVELFFDEDIDWENVESTSNTIL